MTNLQLAVADPGENHEPGKTKLAAVNRNHLPSFERSHNRKRNSLDRLTGGIKGMHAPLLRDDVKQDYSSPLLFAEEEASTSCLVAGRNGIGKDVARRELARSKF
jgi:hypothetical protein